MASFAAGTWRLIDTQNFDEYMKAVGVGYVLRKMANLIKPTQEISVEGDKWNIKTISTLKTTDISFELGKEFDEMTADGRKVKSMGSLVDQKLVVHQKGEPDSTISRTFDGKEMIMTLTAKDVTCTRKYEKEETS
ncbi:hypothetical protein ScPMuIL_006002 [Solemya velum]